MVKKGKLTAKQEAFVLHYTMLGANTYNNAMQSALKAGYSKGTATLACRDILDKPTVKQALAVRRAENEAESLNTVQAIRNKHIQYMKDAEDAGDKALARLNLQDLGRTYAAYTDKAVIDNEFTLNIQRFTVPVGSHTLDSAPVTPVGGQTALGVDNVGVDVKTAQIKGESDNE